jgi:hypothetical protein
LQELLGFSVTGVSDELAEKYGLDAGFKDIQLQRSSDLPKAK